MAQVIRQKPTTVGLPVAPSTDRIFNRSRRSAVVWAPQKAEILRSLASHEVKIISRDSLRAYLVRGVIHSVKTGGKRVVKTRQVAATQRHTSMYMPHQVILYLISKSHYLYRRTDIKTLYFEVLVSVVKH